MRKFFAKQAVVTPFEDTTVPLKNHSQSIDGRGSNEDVDWQYVQIPHPPSSDRPVEDNEFVRGMPGNKEHRKQGGPRENAYPSYEETHKVGKGNQKKSGKQDNLSRHGSTGDRQNLFHSSHSPHVGSRDTEANSFHTAPLRQNSVSGVRQQNVDHDHFPNPHFTHHNRQQDNVDQEGQLTNRSLEYVRPQQTAQQSVHLSDDIGKQYEHHRLNVTEQNHNILPLERSYDRYIDRTDDIGLQKSNQNGKGRMKNWLVGLKKKGDDKRSSYMDTEYQNNLEGYQMAGGQPTAMNGAGATSSGRNSPSKKKSDHQPPNWLDWKGKTKSTEKVTGETLITQQIGWLCAQDEQFWEYGHIAPLVAAVSQSEAASKEATTALKDEFKLGADVPQFGAVKLMAMLFLHADETFKLQMANKRFLEALEDMYKDENTPTQTRGRLLVVWSMFAHQSRDDNSLKAITKMFNKIKPSGMPVDGTPLDPHMDLFYTQDEVQRPNEVQQLYEEPVQNSSGLHGHDQANPTPFSNGETQDQFAVLGEAEMASNQAAIQAAQQATVQATQHARELQRLHEESNVARNNAHLLTETLIEDGLDAPLLPEFAEKTELFHSFISQQIPWASSMAEQAKARREELNGKGQMGNMLTEEEKVLEDLLDAHEKVIHAQSMIEQAKERRREEEEEAQVIDRSMREMRMDRSALITDPETGEMYHIENLATSNETSKISSASRSRSVSPSPLLSSFRRDDELHEQRQSGLLAPPMQSQISSTHSATESSVSRSSTANNAFSQSQSIGKNVLAGPRPLQQGSPMKVHSVLLASNDLHITTNAITKPITDEGEESVDIVTPIVPSEKALGKRRAMSVHQDNEDPFRDEITSQQESSNLLSLDAASMQPTLSNDREGVLLTRPPPALPQ